MIDELKNTVVEDKLLTSEPADEQFFPYRDQPYTIEVPKDTRTIFISAGGGFGGFGSGKSGGPGRGSRIGALVPVKPGEVLTITLGGAADGVNPGRGLKWGGTGGAGGNTGCNGGGGGGSSAVAGSQSGLLIEAGGGGGAGGEGDLRDGGDGGVGGLNPASGGDGDDGPFGKGGVGGKGGDPKLTERGGDGGVGSHMSPNGGGGGGGGGIRCGGGGGYGTGGAGGGGGGGASQIVPAARGVSTGVTTIGNGFVVLLDDGNFFKIVSAKSTHNVVAVSYASPDPGRQLVWWPYEADASQQWQVLWIDKEQSLCKIVSLLSGLVIAVGSDSGYPPKIIQWSYTGDPSQHWRLVRIAGDRYKIVSAASDDKVIAASPDFTDGHYNLVLWPYEGDSSQEWALAPLDF